MRYYLILFFALLLFVEEAFSQLVTGNAFLKDTFVEVAVGPCGNFASTVVAPIGYHPRGSGTSSSTRQLGFVANPAKNNWASYVGDYFLPGTPEEGFGLTVNGVNYNNNLICGTVGIPGSIISTQSTGLEVSGTWQGKIAGLTITAKTFIPAGSLYFVTKVTITNTSGSPVNNIYYMRNVDPDHGRSTPGSTGSFSTYNSIVYQNPNSCNRALASATTHLGSGEYLGLGSVDSRAKVTHGGFSNRSARDIWNGTTLLQQTGTNVFEDMAISISFNLGSLAPNASTSFAYAYILNEPELEQALAATNIGLGVASASVNVGNTNDICAGTPIPISLSNIGTYTSWIWSPATGLDTTKGTLVHATISSPTTYTATGTGPCGTVSITVSLKPVVLIPPGNAGVISGPTNIAVGQTDITYSIPPVPNATKYEWRIPEGATINSSPDSNVITISTSNNAWCGKVVVTPKNACGTGAASSLDVCVSGAFSLQLDTATIRSCPGPGTAKLNYRSPTGNPNFYSLVWSLSASAAGFSNISNANLPASPISLQVPAGVNSGTYTANLTVGNGTFNSVAYPITLTIISPVAKDTSLTGCNRLVYKGTTYTTSTIRRDTARSYLGCDSLYTIANITVIRDTLIGEWKNLKPINGNSNVMLPLTLSWSRIDSANLYDLYLWPVASAKPSTPTVSGVTDTSYTTNDSILLEYEVAYNWQVVAKRVCYTLASPIQVFTLQYSPDLVVDSVNLPQTGFAGRTIKISWKVKNTGKRLTTTNEWSDRVYISASPVFSAGSALSQYDFVHNGNLQPDSSYTQFQEILLPANISGQYYVHVFTDADKQLSEYNIGGEENNIRVSDPFNVSLKMPADLVVSQVIAPAKASAGQKTNIKWVTKNLGDTAISEPLWYDKIYVSTSASLNINNAILVASYSHSGGLDANSEYSNSVLVTVPVVPAGNYYVHVIADAEKNAFEYDENNNVKASNLMFVRVPDLMVSNVSIPGSVNAGQKLKVTWNIRNTGTGATETASWTDRIFLSPDNTYSPDNAIWFDVKFAAQTVETGASINREIELRMPDIVSGRYYAFVYTDFGKAVYEDTSEYNNISRSTSFSDITTGVPVNDIGISEIITPVSDCGLIGSETVKVKISNYGNLFHSGFDVSYRLNNGAVVTENVGSASLLPGSTLLYQFNTKVNLSSIATYTIKAYTSIANDTFPANDTLTKVIQHFPPLASPANLLPADGSLDISKPVTFSWSAVPNSTRYDLFVWKASDTMPATPVASNLAQINYSLSGGLSYGTSYKWRVITKSTNCQTPSAIQTFTTRNLPDLVIDSIVVPANGGTSEAPFSLSWKTKNIGLGTTGSIGWYETIYLSQSATDRSNDVFIAYLPNVSALNAGQSYTQPLYTFTIPQGYQGRYYIVVKTNVARNLEELTDTNNIKIVAIDITLAPPPDLYVDSLVVAPTTLFSEDTLNVGWTVKNIGTGPTTTSSWTDHVYLSKNHILNIAGALRLGSFQRTGALNVNDSYRRSARFKLPPHIGGSYFIHVVTDVSNRVYEYVNENNNTATWDSLNVIMRPNPNLVIASVSIPLDTLSNNQTTSLSWTTKNEGAAPANPTWYDNMRLTMDTANGYRNYYDLGSFIQSSVLQSSSATGSQQNIKLPNNLTEGKYFAYGVTDIYNSVFEGAVEETDNVSPYSTSVYVVNPDLKPTGILAPTNAKSEESITMSWEILNAGKGSVYNSSWSDAIYLSKDSVLDNTDVLLRSVSNNVLLPSGSQYSKQQVVTLPRGISGVYNFIVVADAGNGVFEKSEINNHFHVPINITIAPWADLQITSIQLPATDTAGTNITFSYSGKNFGSAKIDNKTWRDAFYLSPTKNLSDPNRIFLISHSHLRTLDTAQSYTNTVSAQLPSSISGPYYLVGIADDGDNLYEYTSENNNQRVSDTSVSISQLPNVDLAVITGKVVADSLTPGQTVSVEWLGGNAGTTPTIITEWEDAIYLSNNPTLDASDRLLKTVKVNKLLQPATSYNQKTSVVIPNDASGRLYFLVNVDRQNQQNDINRSNNTRVLDIVVKDSGQVVDSGGGVVIVPPLPSDLTPISFTAAATGVSGQPFDLSYSVINNGKGITNNSTWIDRAYLSNNLVLDAGDRVIGSFPHNGKLASMMQYVDTQQVFIPSDVAGNYVVIFKTDDNDNVFELNAENNNTAFGNILIQPQQPCDLVVSDVTPPVGTQIAGRNITINYSVQNVGSNPAQGYFSNAVYLSKDTVWDVNDLLLGTAGDYYSLPPQASVNKQSIKRLINVAAGNYYVIVRADILNNMAEVNENNNIRSAVSPVAVDVKLLTMNVLATDTLVNDENLYYRINIPAGQKGETMSLTLKGDSAKQAINRLYLKFGEAPAANSYDFVSEIPFEANQEIIVPELKEGTYYIMASGSNTAIANQSVTLLARIIPFEITKVDARKGGNTGAVTVKINGAKFDSTTIFKLSGVKGAISPEKLYYINSTQVFATFNLLNTDTGFYSVVATKLNNDSARLVNGFEIEKGVGSTAGNNGTGPGTGTGFVCRVINIGFEDQLRKGYEYPPSTRPLRVVSITVAYANNGNVDIPLPTLIFAALKNNIPLGFTPEEVSVSLNGLGGALGGILASTLASLVLDLTESNGPPGILRPGANGYKKVYTIAPNDRSITSLDFVIHGAK